MDNVFVLQLPDVYFRWFNLEVLIARGLKNGLYVYTYESYKRANKQIDENLEVSGDSLVLNSPGFRQFMGMGTFGCVISKTGKLTIPNILYKYLGDKGIVSYIESQDWIEIRRG